MQQYKHNPIASVATSATVVVVVFTGNVKISLLQAMEAHRVARG
jgi:hypothetical protein